MLQYCHLLDKGGTAPLDWDQTRCCKYQVGRAVCLQHPHQDNSVLLGMAGHLLQTDSMSLRGSRRTFRPLYPKKRTIQKWGGACILLISVKWHHYTCSVWIGSIRAEKRRCWAPWTIMSKWANTTCYTIWGCWNRCPSWTIISYRSEDAKL